VPHKLAEIDNNSLMKGCANRRRAVAVRCTGCGINDQIVKSRAQMAVRFNCHGPQGSDRQTDRQTDNTCLFYIANEKTRRSSKSADHGSVIMLTQL